MRSLTAVIMLCFAAIGIDQAENGSAGAAPHENSVRVTTSFDARYAGPILHQVARLFAGGFGRAESDRVARDIDGLKADEPRLWQFAVTYHGHPETLEIHALMDDLGMIDLDFAAGADAAPAIRAAVDGYLNSHGH